MLVKFSHHALSRMSERLGITLRASEVDISKSFRRGRTYVNHFDGRDYEAWCYVGPGWQTKKIVLPVNKQQRVVTTVFCGGDLIDNRSAPFVDACYSSLRNKHMVSA